MSEVLSRLTADHVTGLAVVLGSLALVGAVALGIVGMTQAYLARKQRMAAALVSEMVAAGHSAADVVRVLESAGFRDRSATNDSVRILGAATRATAGASPE